ncbi:helix-turn-helix transcriptional regulator [Ktedonosporobacter rubrisoli]|nr:WYL domain-containing protein [Ktedonosporobacter rubrisoli]
MRADRLLSLLMLLQIKGNVTAQELARRLEVSERTIYRDIEALSAAGIPVYTERGPGGGCRLAEGYQTTLTGLTTDELNTLFMPSHALPLADLGEDRALNTAQHKLLATLPSTQQRGIEHTRQRLYLDSAGWYRGQEAVPFLLTLRDAIWHDLKVQIVYRKNSGEIIERVIEPLGLVAKAGIWYMVALSYGKLRVFRVSRVRRASILSEVCTRPADFDLENFWARWSSEFHAQLTRYPVTLRISPAFIPILPQILGEEAHKYLEEAGPADSEGWVVIRLSFDSFEAARSYILGFETMAEVIEPVELRRSIQEVATEIAEFYRLRDQRANSSL